MSILSNLTFLQKRRASSVRVFCPERRAEISHMSPKTAESLVLGFWGQQIMTCQKIMKKGLLGGALKDFFQDGGGKNYINLALYGRGEKLRPEKERLDRPGAHEKSGLGWRGHKKLEKSIYYRNSKISIIAGPKLIFQKSSRPIYRGKMEISAYIFVP